MLQLTDLIELKDPIGQDAGQQTRYPDYEKENPSAKK